MKKLIIPAIVIAAVGGYFYYENMAPAGSEAAIAKDVDSAVQQAGAAMKDTAKDADSVMASNDGVAGPDGDVFADAPEQMETAADAAAAATAEAAGEAMDAAADAMDTAADAASDMADEATEAADEIDHADE